MKKYIQKTSNRMDLQVTILVVIYTFLAVAITSQMYWKYTLEVLMDTHVDRVYSLYQTIEDYIDKEIFVKINSRKDMETELYVENRDVLMNMKKSTGVMYLFTAKVSEEGQFIYVIDGLEEGTDFRYAGDLIETEIIPEMELALQNIEVLPKKIIHTNRGDIFMAYMPFHDEMGEVLGVVGIKFDASNSYQTFKNLQKSTVLMCIIVMITAGIMSIYLFRKITNPLYMNKSNKDAQTGLKNRNAYEIDMNNLSARGNLDKIGIIIADANGLKEVNDRLGHIAGDNYIHLVAECLRNYKTGQMVAYRTGGDEFVIIVQEATEEILKDFAEKCTKSIKNQKQYNDMRCSIAYGYTMFDKDRDIDLNDTFCRADDLMYQEKRRQKEDMER